jgi:hypothetical protein
VRVRITVDVVNANSGFMIAFYISYAVEAIKKNPIGPLRKVKAAEPDAYPKTRNVAEKSETGGI